MNDEPHVSRGYFPPLSSNTTRTPNQFFDLVLRTSSRGVVRLVAFLVRKSLGWCDEEGNPIEMDHYCSRRDLVEKVGISEGSIGKVLKEALDRRFVETVVDGRPHRPGEPGHCAMYRLRYDDEGAPYTTDPREFNGFFNGVGHYLPCPNAYLDHVVRHEPLSVAQTVGYVLRKTIGFRVESGFRRRQAAVSIGELSRFFGVSKWSVKAALEEARGKRYVRRFSDGVFSPDVELQRPSVYGLFWADEELSGEPIDARPDRSPQKPPQPDEAGALKNLPRPEKPCPQKPPQADGTKSTPESPQNPPQEALKNLPSVERKLSKENSKDQQQPANGVDAALDELHSGLLRRLAEHGVQERVARRLVEERDPEVVARQLDWIRLRNVRSSLAGLLITAIEQDLPRPSGPVRPEAEDRAFRFAQGFYDALAGASAGSVVLPSPGDLEAASALLRRLEGLGDEDPDPHASGARFGAFFQADAGSRSLRALAFAVRQRGDDWLADLERARRAEVQRDAVEAQRRAAAELRCAYEGHLDALAQRLADSEPALRDSFEEADRGARERLAARTHRLSPRAASVSLAEFDRDESRRERLREFLLARRALPTFDAFRRTQERGDSA